MDKRNERTREERIALFNKVEELRKTGMTRVEACQKVGITEPSYNNWRFLFGSKKKKVTYKKKKKPKVEVLSIPMQEGLQIGNRTYLVVGYKRDIIDILNGVN